MFILPSLGSPQRTGRRSQPKQEAKAVPAGYTGTWVCQTGVPGQTMIHSNVNVITGTLAQTTTTTTPGVAAIKFAGN